MIFIIWLLFISVTFGLNQSTTENYVVVQTSINELTEQNTIDEVWTDQMISAPIIINQLGQVMVIVSSADVSFEQYSPNHVYKYIKYPKSFRATLLQISNEGYRAFLNAHSSMNKIRLYMRQIPQHTNTMIKTISSNISTSLARRILSISKDNIERISKTCVTLATDVNSSFTSVMNLLGEVIEIMEVTKSLRNTSQQAHEMLQGIYQRLVRFVDNWDELGLLLSHFSAGVKTRFDKDIQLFLNNDREEMNVDRNLISDILNENSVSCNHDVSLFYMLSRTYYDVSTKYIMPRLAKLSLMLAAANNDERKVLLRELKKDTKNVQFEIQKLINERNDKYKEIINGRRAKLQEKAAKLGADEIKEDIINQGKNFLIDEDWPKEQITD